MAIELDREDTEAVLNAQLAALLLAQPLTSTEGVEEIIALLQRSLSLLSAGHPLWLDVAVNLASAYHRRPIGDVTENWEAERQLLERAIEVCDRVTDTPKWALIQTNNGLLLAERPGGNREDLTRGIEHIEAGLKESAPGLRLQPRPPRQAPRPRLHGHRPGHGGQDRGGRQRPAQVP
jgi:hypothetical protein